MASTNQFSSVLAIDDVSIASMKLNTSTVPYLLDSWLLRSRFLHVALLSSSGRHKFLMVRKAAFFIQL